MGLDNTHLRVLRELAVVHNLREVMENGDIPEDWKKANVTPIYKKGLKEDPGNYRPFSLNFSPWERYGTNPPGGNHKSNDACDSEKPAWIHQGQTMLDKPDCLLRQSKPLS